MPNRNANSQKSIELRNTGKLEMTTDDITVSSEETELSESDDDTPLAQVRTNSHQSQATTGALVGTNSYIDSELNEPSTNQTPTRLKRDLPALARACDRHGISDRTGAAIASAVLQDFGLISPEDQGNVVDRNKVRRARHRKRSNLQQMNKESQDVLHSLFFDGRKDHTIMNVQKGSKWYRKNVVEEHISLIEEPGSKYLGHVTPLSGTAEAIKQTLMDFLNERYESLNKFVAIGCDGTNVNTGRAGGTIRLMEEELQKPLQWLICQLHANELPLRHLLIHLDGATSGPRAFTGKIGMAISVCEKLPIVVFKPIESDLPPMTAADLNTDQKYLYEMCEAVSNGYCSEPLSRRNPGAPLI